MQCVTCKNWITRRVTLYEDGSQIETYGVAPGQNHGHCDALNMDTQPDFGCNKYEEGGHEAVTIKKGAPWQNWHFGPCPDCKGVGCHMVELRPACMHCAGLGYVRHYDDGYIADKSWDHPKEKALKKQARDDVAREQLKQQARAMGLKVEDHTDNPDPNLTLAPRKKDEGLFEGGSL